MVKEQFLKTIKLVVENVNSEYVDHLFVVNAYGLKVLPLFIIEAFVLDELKKNHPNYARINKFSQTKSRKRELIKYKHLFYKVANEHGHSYNQIGIYVKNNHANIRHGRLNCTAYIKVDKDEEVIKAFSNVTQNIQNYVDHIQQIKNLQSDTK